MEKDNNWEQKFEICKATRLIAANSLRDSLEVLLNSSEKISEMGLREKWLEEMRRHDLILSEGWYAPPPFGIGILFGSDSDGENNRLNFASLRSEQNWPCDDMFLNPENGLVYAFASPVHKSIGIIGDFGMTIYFGKDERIKNLLRTSLTVNRAIHESIALGQKLSDIYNFAEKKLHESGLENKIFSVTDPAAVNIGHTIPASYENWSEGEKNILESRDMEKISELISKKRRYINNVETLRVGAGMGLTIEPRPRIGNAPNVPMVSFHTICLANENGEMELLENFEEIFKLAGMDYMFLENYEREKNNRC